MLPAQLARVSTAARSFRRQRLPPLSLPTAVGVCWPSSNSSSTDHFRRRHRWADQLRVQGHGSGHSARGHRCQPAQRCGFLCSDRLFLQTPFCREERLFARHADRMSYQTGYIPSGEFGRVCDVCARLRPGRTFRKQDDLWICDFHPSYISRKTLDRVPFLKSERPTSSGAPNLPTIATHSRLLRPRYLTSCSLTRRWTLWTSRMARW